MKRLLMLWSCIFMFLGEMSAQTMKVTGVVTSAEDAEPVIGASILVKGTTSGTITGMNGEFTISSVPSTAKILVVSFVGMISQEVPIKSGMIKILLKPDSEVLDEVVVTAMGVSRQKKALGYALQEVGGQELTKAGQMNVGNALSGKVAGLQVTQAGGAVGASQRIVIRGNSSFGDNQPLIVVDGVPIINDQSSSDSRDGLLDLGSGLNDINPDDIESISVLKGGSAALYGMRAGNGVILITTKSGKKKEKGVTVNYNLDFTVDQVFHLPKLQNKYGQGAYASEYYYKTGEQAYDTYADFATGAGFSYVDGDGSGVNDNDDESWGPRLDVGLMIPQFNSPVVNGARQATPWISHSNNIKDFFQLGTSQNHNLAFTSVKDNSTVRAALGYRDQVGTIENTGLKKYSAQISATYNINKYVDFDMATNYTNSESGNMIATGYTASNPMQSILEWFGRQVDMKDLKAKWNTLDAYGNPYNWNTTFHVNPYYNVNKNVNEYNRDRFFGKTSLFFKPFEFLKFEGRLGYDMYSYRLMSKIAYDTDHKDGWFRETKENQKELNADFIAYFNDHFGKLSVDGLAGANYRDMKWNQSGQGAGASGLTVPELYTMSNVKGSPYTNMDNAHVRSNSVYANLSLGWDSQLYLEASARNDWSSTIKDNFFYPSVSLSWIPTETFKSLKSDAFNFLKFRAGWAKIGNATSAYRTGLYYTAQDYTIGGVTQYSKPTTAPFDDLKPEKVLTTEFGVEASFFKNRLHLDADYYTKTTSDQIMSIEVPRSTGYYYALINAGKIRNRGVELQLTGKIFENSRGFNWTATLNWAKDKSKIMELTKGIDTYTIGSKWSTYNYAKIGDTWGSLYGKGFTYDEKGRVLIGDDGLPELTSNQKIGDVTPDWIAGLQNEFSYKNLSFGFLLDYRKGGDFFSVTQMFGAYTGILDYTAKGSIRESGVIVGKDVLTNKTCVTSDGSENTVRVSAQDYYQSYYSNKELDICDGSFLKLREMHLTYTFPKVVLEKIKYIKAANISFIANNVAILWLSSRNQSKIDPESSMGSGNDGVGFESNSVPPTRSFGLKLGLTF